MYEILKNFIRSKAEIDNQSLEEVCSYFQLIQTKRNEILLSYDQISKHYYFINKGSVRLFTNTKDGMSQLSPASLNEESVNPMAQVSASGMASGRNAQKEQAFNMLSSVGGGGQGGDTLSQQTEMINNLKSIEPILNTAQNFLDKFENSSISKMFSSGGGFPGMSLLTGGGGGNKTSPAPVGDSS